jgi:phosphoglucosamine mutase
MGDDVCELCEAYIDNRLSDVEVFGKKYDDIPFATGDRIGATVDYVSGRNRYVGYLISNGLYSFKGCKVALDCANGSSWNIAKSVFEALGATTYVINAEPNGTNINQDAGSTHIEGLQKYVVDNKFDVGFAYDGDADRCLAVSKSGKIIDGDAILYIVGSYLKKKNMLLKDTVVATIMSNYGLFKSLEALGIKYKTTKVGDKYVSEEMRKGGYSIGGEQSGHIIFSKLATTGDGILTSIKLMEIMIDEEKGLDELVSKLEIYPQTLINVRVSDKDTILSNENVMKEKEIIEKELSSRDGRLVLRKSGTEPVIRVLVEAKSKEDCDTFANRLVKVIEEG